jgi:hypothetical protein
MMGGGRLSVLNLGGAGMGKANDSREEIGSFYFIVPAVAKPSPSLRLRRKQRRGKNADSTVFGQKQTS